MQDGKRPSSEKRQKIVHDFAKWTALSALRSGSPLKGAAEIYHLIDHSADLACLFDGSASITDAEFDRWHEATVTAFCRAEPILPVGWAAKIINVYLKTRVYLAGEGRKGLVAAIHPPIHFSREIVLTLAYPDMGLKKVTIKSIVSYRDDYMLLIEAFRSVARQEGCLLIEVEAFWQTAQRAEAEQ
jgi:hypothetical protein